MARFLNFQESLIECTYELGKTYEKLHDAESRIQRTLEVLKDTWINESTLIKNAIAILEGKSLSGSSVNG